MAEATNYKAPSAKTINFLYNGIVAFYPEVAKEAFGLGKVSLPFHESWGGFKRLEFLEFCLNIAGPEITTIEEAASIVSRWKRGEGLEKTVPEKLDEMVSRLEEEEEKRKTSAAKQAQTYEKQKLVKDTLLESQKAKEASSPPQEKTPAATDQPPSITTTPETETPSLKKEAAVPSTPAIGINITPEAGKVFQKFTNRVVSLPVRAAVAFAAPTIALESGGATSSALTLWTHGIKSQVLEEKASTLAPKEAKRVGELIRAIKGIETSYSLQTRILQRSFPVKDIALLLGPDAGLTQAQIAVFFNPPEQGGAIAVPRRSFFGNLFVDAGKQLFGKLSSKAIKGLASKAAAAITGEAAGAAAGATVGAEAGAAAGAAVGGPAAPLTAIIGAILGWIASKIPALVSWIKRNAKEFGIAAAALLTAGVFFSNPILLISGLALGAIALGAGGLSSLGAGVTGLGQAVLSGITTILLPTVGVPILVGLISVPIIVAVILFIINSGAYVVPPSTFSLAGENPYIGVVKEVSPAGPFSNNNLPLSVSYTITVTARRGTLTNISFNHECQIISRSGTSNCPAPLPSDIPQSISPAEEYVYSYSQTYSGVAYRDSLVINTFTVTADTPEVTGTSASGAASIIIGNPPTGCYNVAGSWPAAERANILSAISNLVGNRSAFVSRLCAAYSQVNLYYDPPRVCGAWGCAPDGNVIYFNSGGLGNVRNATYILAHESGHVLAYGSPSLYQAYLAFPGTLSELPVCTYGGSEPAEGFAEAIAKFSINDSCLNNEPNNKRFVETRIFR